MAKLSLKGIPIEVELAPMGEGYDKIRKRLKQWFPRGPIESFCSHCGFPFRRTVDELMDIIEKDETVQCVRCGYIIIEATGKPGQKKEKDKEIAHVCQDRHYQPALFNGEDPLTDEESIWVSRSGVTVDAVVDKDTIKMVVSKANPGERKELVRPTDPRRVFEEIDKQHPPSGTPEDRVTNKLMKVRARQVLEDSVDHPCAECRKVLLEREMKAEEVKALVEGPEAGSVQLCGECGKPLSEHRKKFLAKEKKWITLCR